MAPNKYNKIAADKIKNLENLIQQYKDRIRELENGNI
jgi:hypothetical protein